MNPTQAEIEKPSRFAYSVLQRQVRGCRITRRRLEIRSTLKIVKQSPVFNPINPSSAKTPKSTSDSRPVNSPVKFSDCSMAAIFRAGGKLKEFVKKYGKVALGVHFSVSAASITGFYLAIKSNVDVESVLEKVGMSTSKEAAVEAIGEGSGDREVVVVERNRTAEMAATSGGAIALAILCNKALFPVRVPITVALTPPIARFLARRRIVQNSL